MSYPPFLIPQDVIDMGSSTVAATTAGTSILIPSTATGAIYVTNFFANAGTASTVSLGHGVAAVAPTTTAIMLQPINLALLSSVNCPLPQPIKIPASKNVLVTFVGGSVASAAATYYVAP